MALDSNRYVKGNVKKSGASPPMLHAGRLPCLSLIWSRTTWSHWRLSWDGRNFLFPQYSVNVVSLGEFLAPWLLTGLPGLQWQAWINGDLVGLALIACQEGFFLQVQVWCGPTLMQNMVVAAPLLNCSPFRHGRNCRHVARQGHNLHSWWQHPYILTGAHCDLSKGNVGHLCIRRIAQSV